MKHSYTVRSLLIIPALLAMGLAQGQQVLPCATDQVQQRLIAENPDLLRQNAEYELGLQAYLQAKAGMRDDGEDAVYVIPIVFHVLYDPTYPNDNHNVSDAAIYAQVNVLNQDFRKLNADTAEIVDPFKPIAADIKVEFQLATKDPFGNCTNGIDRITSQRASQAQDFSKLNPWFRNHYVNVWVIRSLNQDQPGITVLGYSQLPAYVQDDLGALRDGVIMPSSELSTTTLTHELGHFLNLLHVWGDGQVGAACGDDGVEDTPMTKGHLSTCDTTDHSCNSWDIDGAYTFDDLNTGSGATDPTMPPAGLYQDSLPGLTYGAFSANGVSGNPMEDGRFSFSQWDTGAAEGDSAFSQMTGSLNTGKYYEFTVAPTFGKTMTLSGMIFRASRSATGPRTFAVRASTNNNFSSNSAASLTGPDSLISVHPPNTFFFSADTAGEWKGNKVSFTGFNSIRNAVTFRIYAWNAEDGDGAFAVDSLRLIGDFGDVDNAQNYMDYSYCTVMFTAGQRDRMRATLNSPVSDRSSLWQEGNHLYTGTAGHEAACGPESDFYVLDRFVCTGTPIQFKANVKRATATSWAWTFDGGNPATSTDENPIVSFSEPGYHSVTLTAGNDHGSGSVTKTDAFLIGADYPEVNGLLQEPFNNNNEFYRWPNVNYERNSTYWHWSDQAGHNAPGCAKLNASDTYTLIQDIFTPNNFQDKDALVTPILEMPFYTGLSMSFWYAYSTQTATTDDITESLKVYASTDCGKNWLLRLTLEDASLITAGVRSPGYVPAADEWREASFTLPSIFAGNHVRLKFEYSSGLFSNDLYIDDVNINATNVGIDEVAEQGWIGLMPNPATNSLTVVLDLAGAGTGTLSFLDMTGRTVHSRTLNANDTRLELDLDKMGLTSGVYLVRLKHANGQRVERLVVR
ncbi:MAG: PKD domain-containing protein [Flavobacteriales bacterium]|jgi:hypothetical protein|nr:PKD domain-containing protein [Flavobacteriales bacterium]MCB0759783.1 PKD domain-containing protein [Flavobacteriales bacterium]